MRQRLGFIARETPLLDPSDQWRNLSETAETPVSSATASTENNTARNVSQSDGSSPSDWTSGTPAANRWEDMLSTQTASSQNWSAVTMAQRQQQSLQTALPSDDFYTGLAAEVAGGSSSGPNISSPLDTYEDQFWLNYTNCVWNNRSNCLAYNDSFTAAPDLERRYWAIVLLVFPLLTVFGNILVCLSVYRERSLRTVTNYFIVSLAIADIMVAVLVMPLAVYTEVNNGNWYLGEALCDTWVAMDVMCCTASILNLTAISVDRFIAVTQPLKYAQHKNSNRVYIMLALTWVVSLSISSPIALGMNYTERRSQTPELCVFYNSDFLIYSSMGSFYIPCVIMILLYWRIFRAIKIRARKTAAHRKNKPPKPKLAEISCMADGKNVIENKAQTRTTSEASATEDNSQKELLPAGNSVKTASSAHVPIAEETSFTNFSAGLLNTTDTTGEESHNEISRCPSRFVDNAHVIPNDKSSDFNLLSPSSDSHAELPREQDSGYCAPATVEVKTRPAEVTSPADSPRNHGNLLTPPTRQHGLGLKNHSPRFPRRSRGSGSSGAANGDFIDEGGTPKKSVTKFNFHLRHSKKKKEKLSVRRERKATKTLAIVLGVFLLCWVPFFTINIMNAICIRYDLFQRRSECNLEPMLFSFFVWLGYINSFLNPVIYTIFNIEFRKAFKKLLLEPCNTSFR